MLYLYESTKPNSVPLASCFEALCSSIGWKDASWVMVPSESVSREVWVIPFLDSRLLMTLAVVRNCLICSLVRVGSSDADTTSRQVRHSNTVSDRPTTERRSRFM